MKKLPVLFILFVFLTNQAFAYYPNQDVKLISEIINNMDDDSLISLDSMSNKSLAENRLEKVIQKVSRMSASEEKVYTEKLIKMTKKNTKRLKRVLSKVIKKENLLQKISRKTGERIDELKARLINLKSTLVLSKVESEIKSKILSSGGLYNYFINIQNSKKSENTTEKDWGQSFADAIFVLIALGALALIGLVLVLVGGIVLATGGASVLLIVGGSMLVIGGLSFAVTF